MDPRLSADTIPDAMKATTVDNTMPQIFPRIDDPEHNRLRRMMTSDFTFRRAEAMRPPTAPRAVALEDLTIAGQLVRAGDVVLMNLPAGN